MRKEKHVFSLEEAFPADPRGFFKEFIDLKKWEELIITCRKHFITNIQHIWRDEVLPGQEGDEQLIKF